MKHKNGFLLIDALVAIVVVSVGLMAALDLITALQQDFDLKRKYMMAGLLAQSKLEQISAQTSLPVDGNGNFGAEFNNSSYNVYDYTVLTADISAGLVGTPYSLSGISKQVTVNVSFKDMRNMQRTVTVISIKTQRG